MENSDVEDPAHAATPPDLPTPELFRQRRARFTRDRFLDERDSSPPPPGVWSEANLARNVRAERHRRGWSQEALASLMTAEGVRMHQSSIAKIEKESGRRPITVDEAIGLSRVLDIPLPRLLLSPDAAARAEVEQLTWELGKAKEALTRAHNEAQWARVALEAKQQEVAE